MHKHPRARHGHRPRSGDPLLVTFAPSYPHVHVAAFSVFTLLKFVLQRIPPCTTEPPALPCRGRRLPRRRVAWKGLGDAVFLADPSAHIHASRGGRNHSPASPPPHFWSLAWQHDRTSSASREDPRPPLDLQHMRQIRSGVPIRRAVSLWPLPHIRGRAHLCSNAPHQPSCFNQLALF